MFLDQNWSGTKYTGMFSGTVRNMAIQHCHIAQWHEGLKCSGKAEMLFRTASIQDDPSWRTTNCNSLLPCWMLIANGVCELAAEVRICYKTVLHILDYHKLAVHWIPHEISEVQQWHCYAVAQVLLDQCRRECNVFLGRIVTMDDVWACWYEPNLKCQSNEWKHPSSPRLKKCALHNVLWRWRSLWCKTMMG